MNVKKALVREGLILIGFFITALSLFIFLEKNFSSEAGIHFKISLFIFIFMYAGRWVFRIFKGLLLILFMVAIAGILWILLKLLPLSLF